MAHGFAAQLGDELTMTSKLGTGTVVKIHLPASNERALTPPHLPAREVESGLHGTILEAETLAPSLTLLSKPFRKAEILIALRAAIDDG